MTELLTNVVRHVPDRSCTLLLLLRAAAGVRVEVGDRSAHHPVVHDDVPPDEERGRGLVLLEAVTDKWGVGVGPRTAGGKTVWFECRL